MTKLKVLAVGSGAGNILKGIEKSDDVEFWAINTDKQVLNSVGATNKLQIGKSITDGLGAGGNPIIGERAIEENASDISAIINDTELIITVACLGGGATPVIVQKIAEETNAANIAIFTMPFEFEGKLKMRQAKENLAYIQRYADKVIVLKNNDLIPLIGKNKTLLEAFDVPAKIVANWVNEISILFNDKKSLI